LHASLSIAHVDSEPEFRGGQQALLTLARGLAGLGHRQVLISPKDSPLQKRAREAGLAVEALPSGLLSLFRLLRGFDIVHTHSGHAQTSVWLLSPVLSSVRVATRHVAFEPRNRFVHGLKYGRGCDGVIAVSQAVRGILLRAGVSEGKIEVIHTGVEIPAQLPTAEERRAARAAFDLNNDDDFAIGHMGAFTAEKGQGVAVSAAARLREVIPSAHLLLAGDGPLMPAIHAQSEREAGRVTLLGFLSDRERFFAALDLFVMPSLAEAWGLAALEAMAHGVPVIASNVGGLAEIVSPEEGGRLVPPGDAAVLANTIVESAADRDRLRAEGLKGRERARRFSIQQTVERTEAFYRRLLEAASR
jgi:glycosyltransferase involved in cell wall biosynthesis